MRTPSIRELILDLLTDHGLPVREAADRHLAPAFRQRVDGRWLSRDEFVGGVAALRARSSSVEVTVLDELRQDDRYAERHRLTVVGNDGESSSTEVYLFATIDPDGRFASIDEVTRAAD